MTLLKMNKGEVWPSALAGAAQVRGGVYVCGRTFLRRNGDWTDDHTHTYALLHPPQMDAITNEEVKKKLMLERFQEEVSIVCVCVGLIHDERQKSALLTNPIIALHTYAQHAHTEPGLRLQQCTVQWQRPGPAVIHGGCKVLNIEW